MYYNTSNNTNDFYNGYFNLNDYRNYDFIKESFNKTSKRKYIDPCENCPNNPLNNPFSSGFCNCALPTLMNPIY